MCQRETTELWPVSESKLALLVLFFVSVFQEGFPFGVYQIWKGPNNYVSRVDSAKMGHGIMQRNQESSDTITNNYYNKQIRHCRVSAVATQCYPCLQHSWSR